MYSVWMCDVQGSRLTKPPYLTSPPCIPMNVYGLCAYFGLCVRMHECVYFVKFHVLYTGVVYMCIHCVCMDVCIPVYVAIIYITSTCGMYGCMDVHIPVHHVW